MRAEFPQGSPRAGAGHRRGALSGAATGLALALVALLVTLASLELVVRVGAHLTGRAATFDERVRTLMRRSWPALAVPDPDRIFELRPRGHQLFRDNEFVIDLSISSQRLRDREHALRKPPRTYRILAVGDSFTFGWGVNVGDTWWADLARLMARQRSPVRVETVNVGVYNYTFDQQVQRVEALGLAYDPDLIIAGFYYPHVVTIATHTYEDQRSKPWPRILEPSLYVDGEGLLRFGRPVPFEALRQHSALADLVLARYKRLQYALGAPRRLNDFGLLDEGRRSEFRHGWDLTRAAYERLLQLAGRRGIPVVVFQIPRDIQVWPGWKRGGAALPAGVPFRSRLPQETFANMCRDLRMECVDLLPRFVAAATRTPGEPLYYAFDPHWTPAGHRLAAQIIFDYLAARGTAREARR